MTDTPLHIAHVEAGRHFYGGPLQVKYLLNALTARGVRNTLFCPVDSAIAGARLPGTRIIRLPMGGDLDFRLIGRLRDRLRLTAPHLVHLHSRRGADTLGALAARGLAPVVLSRRVDNPERWVRFKYRHIDHVIAISAAIRQVLADAGLSPARVDVIPDAIDSGAWATPRSRADLDAEFGLDPNRVAIAVVAQLIPRKGHLTLLRALPEVVARHPHTRVVLFGRGPLRQKLEAQVLERGLTGAVRFAGFRDDLRHWLGAFDLLVHPASREGMGVAVLQAAAAGIPVVACKAGGIPEVLRDGDTGLLVPPQDPAALADAILRVIGGRADAERRAQRARLWVQQYHSIERMADAHLALYLALLGRQDAAGEA